jgi:uncharacterized membrane protein YcaP (DUF421 family)
VGGKRELAQINVLDLAVLLLVSNALQNRSAGARRVLEGVPRVLLEDGHVNASALRREAITRTELGSIALDRGFSSLAEVASSCSSRTATSR